MILDMSTLEALAREHLVRECRQQEETASRGLKETGAVCPALWLLRDLTCLLEEFRDRPVNDLAPMIRRLILEQNFVDENGDSVFDTQCAAEVEREIALILRALENTRQQALEQGLLSNPQLCNENWFG